LCGAGRLAVFFSLADLPLRGHALPGRVQCSFRKTLPACPLSKLLDCGINIVSRETLGQPIQQDISNFPAIGGRSGNDFRREHRTPPSGA